MSVIELGLVHRDGEEPAAPAPRPAGRRDLRRFLVAVVTVVCVLTVTGSTRPDPAGLPQLWSTQFFANNDSFTLTDDSIYILSKVGEHKITAHDLRTGAVRWSRPTPGEVSWLNDVEAGTLLLPAAPKKTSQEADGSIIYREFHQESVAFDTATGRQLWRAAGELVRASGDRALLAERDKTGEKVTVFRVVRLRDGGTIWSLPAGNIANWISDFTLTGPADRLVTVTAKGDAEVRNLADGAVIATGSLPWRQPSSRDDNETAVAVEGKQIYLDNGRWNRSLVTAYDTETLRQQWQIERPPSAGVFGCGPVLCIGTSTEVAGHDRATGKVLWRRTGEVTGEPRLTTLLVAEPGPNGTRTRMIDATTGRVTVDLGSATPVWNRRSGAVRHAMAPKAGSDAAVLISHVNERTGEVLLRGMIPGVLGQSCQSQNTLVVCLTRDRLLVTDVG